LIPFLRRVYRLLSRQQQFGALKSIAASTLQALLEIISLAAILPLLYQVVGSSNQSSFIELYFPTWQSVVLTVIVVFVAKNILTLLLASYQAKFVNDVGLTMSENLYRRFFSQSWTNYLTENSADVVRKIKTTPSDFSNYILFGLISFLTDLLICIAMLVVMVWFDYRVVGIAVIVSVPVIGMYYIFRKSALAKIYQAFRDLTPRGNIVLGQGVSAFAEANIYQKRNFFVDCFTQLNRIINQHFTNLRLASLLPARIFEVFGVLCLCSIIIYAKVFMLDHEHVLVLIALFVAALYRVIPSLSRMFVTLSQLQAYSYSVYELQDCFNANDQPSAAKSHMVAFEKSIHLKDVCFTYQSGAAAFCLENVNLTFHKGNFAMLRGPSGAGKTTFLHLLAGLLTNYDGQILIDDKELTSSTREGWQSNLGFVPQAAVILQDTILNNVAFGEYKPDREKARDALSRAGLLDFVDSLPETLDTPISEFGLTLSGGQRQRLVLARALYRNPSVLILDEVTNQLDDKIKNNILLTLKGLAENGTTIILVTHDASIAGFANRNFIIADDTLKEIAAG